MQTLSIKCFLSKKQMFFSVEVFTIKEGYWSQWRNRGSLPANYGVCMKAYSNYGYLR